MQGRSMWTMALPRKGHYNTVRVRAWKITETRRNVGLDHAAMTATTLAAMCRKVGMRHKVQTIRESKNASPNEYGSQNKEWVMNFEEILCGATFVKHEK
jgi:hypothetical protein